TSHHLPEGPMIRRSDVIIVALVLLAVGGLFVNKILYVQESSKRYMCSDHLRSLGRALDIHQDFYGHFRAGTVASPDLPPDRRLSWYIEVWGFLTDGGKLLFDKNLPWDAEGNLEPKYRAPKDNDRVEVIGEVGWLVCPKNPSQAGPGM